MTERELTAERLRELLVYEPETGVFRRRVDRAQMKAGSIAGTVNSEGYLVIEIDHAGFIAQRLAYLWMEGRWPPERISFGDRDRLNLRWSNLRCASRSQTKGTEKRRKDNKTGFKGVFRHSISGKYTAKCRRKHLGLFDTPEEAHAAYWAEAQRAFGEFARAA